MENKEIAELKAEMVKKDTILNRLLKAVGLSSEPVNMTMTDSTGATLTIEREAGDPAVGDKASPDGTFTMDDGKVITVSGGAITEITEEDETEMDDLKAENEKLKAEIETLKGANETAAADLATQLAEAKQAVIDAQALKAELSTLKSKYFPQGRQQQFDEPKPSKLQEAIAKKKADIEAKKKK